MDLPGLLGSIPWNVLGVVLALVAGGVFLAFEYQVYMLHTTVLRVPGGFLFKSKWFECEMQREGKAIVVRSRYGLWVRQPVSGGEKEEDAGLVDMRLPAPGLRMDVKLGGGGEGTMPVKGYSVVFRASDGFGAQPTDPPSNGYHYTLVLPDVPTQVAQNFKQFANRLDIWIERLERDMADEAEARRRREEEAAAKAAAAAATAHLVAPELSDDPVGAQIALWRHAAGFSGLYSEVGLNQDGGIDWFVDLAEDGRITLVNDRRTYYGSLKGASIGTLGSEIEINVREVYWTPENPDMCTFRLFKGSTPEVRRLWKDRLIRMFAVQAG